MLNRNLTDADLIKAAKNNDIATVQDYIAQHKNNPEALNKSDNQNDHTDIAELLIAHSANVNQALSNGTTPLYIAARLGQKDIVEFLLTHGANVDQASSDGSTPLYIAAQQGHKDIAELLLVHGANVDQARSDGATPLYVAARLGQKDIVEFLLTHGANVDQASSDGSTPLYIAAQQGHKDIAELLLVHGANVNQASSNGTTPLYIAAYQGHKNIAELLLVHDANVNQASSDGYTPLYVAASQGQKDIVEFLLTHGANVNQALSDGTTPLYIAAQQGQKDIVEFLLTHGANVDQAKSDGSTPLCIAASQGQKDIVEFLLTHGANVNQARDTGATPLFIAAQLGHNDVVEFLIAHGANVNLSWCDPYSRKSTPLQWAIDNRHMEIIKLLISTPDILIDDSIQVDMKIKQYLFNDMMNIKDINERETALLNAAGKGVRGKDHPVYKIMCIARDLFTLNSRGTLGEINKALADIQKIKKAKTLANNAMEANFRQAAENNDIAFVQNYIAQHKSNPDALNKADNLGRTALYLASRDGHKDIIELLIAHGAEVNQARNIGITPLFIAAEKGHKDIAELLLVHGANVNQARSDGATPLFIAAETYHKDIVEFLLTHGANVNQARDTGTTPLYIAAQKGHKDIVEFLLMHGANVNQARDTGTTPLFIAAQKGHKDIVEFLLMHGANVNLSWSNSSGRKFTPLQWAIENRHMEIIKLLISAPDIHIDDSIKVDKKLKEYLFNDIISIKDIKKRETALLNAAGKGVRGKDHPVYKIMCKARDLFTLNSRGTLGEINKALADIQKTKKVEKLSSSAMALQALAPPPNATSLPAWSNQFANFADVQAFLKNDPLEMTELLDQMDVTNQSLRDYLFHEAETHPYITYMMLEKGVVREEDMQQLNGKQRSLWEWLQHLNLSVDVKEYLKQKLLNKSGLLNRYLSQDSNILAELNALTNVEQVKVTQTQATLYASPVAQVVATPLVIPPPSLYNEATMLKLRALPHALTDLPDQAPKQSTVREHRQAQHS